MKSKDLNSTREEARQAMMTAIKENNEEAFADAFQKMGEGIAEDLRADYEQSIADARESADREALSARGVRQLTSKEKEFYQNFAKACEAKNPQQALSDMNLAFPETVINAVFEDIRANHPLLSKIRMRVTNAKIKMFVNTNDNDKATWGDLCDEIIKEAAGGLKEIDSGLFKLSAFLFVCKQILALGPEWIDRFVREILYEYFANGLEYGFVTGTGKSMPIGMDRQVGEDVVVVAGVYPQKELITITKFDIKSLGHLIAQMCITENGRPRLARNLILLVHPADYYDKVAPATMIMAPDGSYCSTMPFGIEVIQSQAVAIGEAIFGLADKYDAFVGSGAEGNIEYSDHYHFLEDERTYIVKGFANGRPRDDKAFVRLDISGVVPQFFQFENVTYVPSDDATLANLKIGSLTLTPTFAADEDTYTAATTNATNIVTATAADAGASIAISVNDVAIENGTAATWETGENEVEIVVTAEDGSTTMTYTVTVTKS